LAEANGNEIKIMQLKFIAVPFKEREINRQLRALATTR